MLHATQQNVLTGLLLYEEPVTVHTAAGITRAGSNALLIERLEEGGLITVQTTPRGKQGREKKTYQLTGKGRALAEAIQEFEFLTEE